jgi:lipopolysaccharide export system permease protein
VKILHRYILREHLGPLAFALSALTSLLLLNYIAKQFGNLVGKGLPWTAIGEFFVLSIPFTIAMTLPMAVLVSTLYAFSRLAAENEITALRANGVGMARLIVPVLFGAALTAAVMVAFNDQVLPRANHRLRTLQSDIARKKPTFALREQVINEISPGQLFLRAGHLDEGSSRMREVTIYDLSDPTRRRTIYADSGMMGISSNRRDLLLTLYHGQMQEVQKSTPEQLQRLFYDIDHVRVKGVANQFDRDTTDTYKSDREMSICEMQEIFANATRDRALARHELADAMARAVHEAATGEARAPDKAPPPPRILGLSAAYCGMMASVFGGVREAEAATLPPQRPVPPPQPVPPAGSPGAGQGLAGKANLEKDRRALQEAARIAAEGAQGRPATPVAPPISPPAQGRPPASLPMAALGGTIDATRSRISDSEQTIDAYDVEIQKKFALAAACIVFVLLGAPIALRFPRGGAGLTIGVSLFVFGLYYVGLIAGEALADRDILSPFWAMWGANVLFTAVGAYLLARMGSEGSTARGGGDLSQLVESLTRLFRRDRAAPPAPGTAADGRRAA